MKEPWDLTPAEFEIIEILWKRSTALSVGQVTRALRGRRPVAYTTVMTLLDKMAKKGSVGRVKSCRAYFYTPSVRRDDVMRFLLRSFVDTYWGGEKERLSRFVTESRNRTESSQITAKASTDSPPRADTSHSKADHDLAVELL